MSPRLENFPPTCAVVDADALDGEDALLVQVQPQACFGLLKLFALGKRAPALGPRPGPGRISTPPRALRGSSRKASERLGQAFITAEPCRSDDREKQGARLDLPRISLLHGCQTTSSSSISSRGMLLPLVPYMYLSRLQALGP